MLNQTVWWKYIVVLVTVTTGLFYALPNIYGKDPGIQIRGARGLSIQSAELARVESILDSGTVPVESLLMDENGIRIRFVDNETQLRAKELLETGLGNNYSIALTLLSGAPQWLTDSGALPMYLGLDLRGGVHFLLQVDMQSAVTRAEDRYQDNVKSTLRENKLRYRSVIRGASGNLEAIVRNPGQRIQALEVLKEAYPDLEIREDENNPEKLLLQLSKDQIREIREFALEQNLTALRNRVDQLGVAEPVVQRQGDDRIVIQFAGCAGYRSGKSHTG